MISKNLMGFACLGSDPPPPPPPPAPPPPPPITLDQDAPKTSTGSTSDQLSESSAGIKKYRNPSTSIGPGAGSTTLTGLGINQ